MDCPDVYKLKRPNQDSGLFFTADVVAKVYKSRPRLNQREEVAALPVNSVDRVVQGQRVPYPAVGGIDCNVRARKLGDLVDASKKVLSHKWQCVPCRQLVCIGDNYVARCVAAAEVKRQAIGDNLTAPGNNKRGRAARRG